MNRYTEGGALATYTHDDQQQIRELLVGRKVIKIADDRLQLDDGRILRFLDHEGCGGCPSGNYELTELNDADNIITAVKFKDDPVEYGDKKQIGSYKIFVFAEKKKINLATFEGTDGNGQYGTGYSIEVLAPSGNEKRD